MAKLAVDIDYSHVQRHSRHGGHNNARPREDTRDVPDRNNTVHRSTRELHRVAHTNGSNELDGHDDRPTVHHSEPTAPVTRHVVHKARDVTDAELIPTIKFPIELDVARAPELLSFIVRTAGKWDASAWSQDMTSFAQQLLQAREYTYDLDGGGVVMFWPIAPNNGGQAVAHFYIWDPLWMSRPEILRSILADATRRWDLHRINEWVPANNILGCRNAERIGFKYEGAWREAVVYTVNGHHRRGDMNLYGLVRSEFDAWRQ